MTCGSRYSLPSARLGSSISASKVTKGVNDAMATLVRGCEGCQPESQTDPRRRNPLCSHQGAICISAWHFGLTRPGPPKKRALNSPALHKHRGMARVAGDFLLNLI